MTWLMGFAAIASPRFTLAGEVHAVHLTFELPTCVYGNGWARTLYYEMFYCSLPLCSSGQWIIMNNYALNTLVISLQVGFAYGFYEAEGRGKFICELGRVGYNHRYA